MAQTRAIGKAYRNILVWIIKAAGYECPPAEEMDYLGNVPDAPKAEQPQTTEEPAPAMKAVPVAAEKQEEAPAPAATSIKYASAKQKEEIIRHLNNPVITRQEKQKCC